MTDEQLAEWERRAKAAETAWESSNRALTEAAQRRQP